MSALFILCVLGSAGWEVVCELPSGGYPMGVTMDKAIGYSVEMYSEGTMTTHFFNLTGAEVGTAETSAVTPADRMYSFDIHDSEDGIESVVSVRCSSGDDILWATDLDRSHYLEELPGKILPSDSGGCFAVYSPSVYQGVWKLARLDSSGTVLFSNSFSLSGGPVISMNHMTELSSGGVVITGVTDDLGMNLFMVLLGFDRSGSSLFFHRDSLRFHGSGEIVDTDSEDNIYVCGFTGYERDDGYFMPPADTDVFLICYSPSGAELWRTTVELPLSNRPTAMQIDESGSVVLVISSCHESLEGPESYYLVDFHPIRAGFTD